MLEALFKEFWSLLNAKTDADETFQKIQQHYSNPPRAYHNLNHIEACLVEYEKVKLKLHDPASVFLAIVFHDIIYDPKNKDNEARSADLAEAFLNEAGIDPILIENVKSLILATRHPTVATNQDEAYLLDIDLSILGQSEERFKQFDDQIRIEYKHVLKPLYKIGRKKLLKSILKSDKIYQTEFFFDCYENQARINILKSLANKL